MRFSDAGFDNMEVRWTPDGAQPSIISLASLGGLKDIVFDTVQAGLEAAATVTRVPGIPSNPAAISDMTLFYAGTRNDALSTPVEFTKENLQIVVLAPKGDSGYPAHTIEGWEDVHLDNTKGDKNPGQGAMSYLHYNISLNPDRSISLWDKYEWWDSTKSPPKAKTRGFEWNPAR